jgi:hypothetical protein
LFRKQCSGKASHKAARRVPAVTRAVGRKRLLEPLLRSFLELRSDNRRQRESERAGRPTQPVRVMAQRFDGFPISSVCDDPLGQLRNRAELIACALQVLLSQSGREPVVVEGLIRRTGLARKAGGSHRPKI